MQTPGKQWLAILFLAALPLAQAEVSEQVVDLPTRSGVSQRLLVLSPPQSKAAVILFAGGHGGLQISPEGKFGWGEGNFLVRTRQLFAEQALQVIVMDAPSDRQQPPFLDMFRQTAEHAEDIQAVIAWARQQSNIPVWLIGTSRGSESAAFGALQLAPPSGPDGLVLTSTVLTGKKSNPVPAMALSKIHIPVLVVHHEQDDCSLCSFSSISLLMNRLTQATPKQLLSFQGGESQGDPCGAYAHHGYNGLEKEVVVKIAEWVLGH